MKKPPTIFDYQNNLNENLKEKQYKYTILLNLRDHEHSVLWQKFNVFLGFNTITIAVIAAVLSFQKFSSGLPFPFGFSLEVLVLFAFIFLIAFISSVFLLIILKGSNFWINFWETKLYLSEFFVSSDELSPIEIFRDHASRVKEKIKEQKEKIKSLIEEQKKDRNNDELTDEINKSQKELEEFQEIIRTAKKKGYISTRNSMEYLVKAILIIWAFLFVSAATLSLYLYFHLTGMGVFFVFLALELCTFAGYYYFAVYKNRKELDELLKKIPF